MRTLILRLENEESLKTFVELLGIPYNENMKKIEFGQDLSETEISVKRVSKPRERKENYFMAIDHWVGMPEFIQPKNQPLSTIKIFIEEYLIPDLSSLLDLKITDKTKSLRFPYRPHRRSERLYYA